MCDNHQCQQREQIKWHESDGQSICQHAEKRRHQAGSEIGTGHLQTYNSLGLVRTEMIRCRMNQAWIDRCAANTDGDDTDHCQCLRLDKGIPWQRNVLDVLEKAWQTCAQEPAHYDIKVRYTLSTAIALIAEHMISIQTDISPKHLRDSERIKTMLQYIMDNYGEAIDTTAIARSASVSESECLRCFRAAIGTTPIRYLREYRIEQAANRLANSQASIADIAAGCGFQDISYFTKIFREMKGVTPKVYQKEH